MSAIFSSGSTLGKFSTGIPARAFCMNSSQIGKAARAPVSLRPNDFCWSSNPTQTPAVSCGVNPMYQASVKSFVVPVLPADGRASALAPTPVPKLTTSSSMATIVRATSGEMTSCTEGRASSSRAPSYVVTRRIRCASMRMPSSGKTVKAETCSITFRSAAPRVMGR